MRKPAQLTPEAARIVRRLEEAAAQRKGGGRTFGAWLRYGKHPVEPDEVETAAERYRFAVLQPWELSALHALKERRPDMVVLCYKCLSSTRSFEREGSLLTSGVSFAEAEREGESWFAHRSGTRDRIEWQGYRGHWQMAVWNLQYRRRWVDNVVREVTAEPWDGVFADNDVFGDYYGLFPLAEVPDASELRDASRTWSATPEKPSMRRTGCWCRISPSPGVRTADGPATPSTGADSRSIGWDGSHTFISIRRPACNRPPNCMVQVSASCG